MLKTFSVNFDYRYLGTYSLIGLNKDTFTMECISHGENEEISLLASVIDKNGMNYNGFSYQWVRVYRHYGKPDCELVCEYIGDISIGDAILFSTCGIKYLDGTVVEPKIKSGVVEDIFPTLSGKEVLFAVGKYLIFSWQILDVMSASDLEALNES